MFHTTETHSEINLSELKAEIVFIEYNFIICEIKIVHVLMFLMVRMLLIY